MPITGITSRVSRLAASLGLTKTDARPVRNATREISAAEYNTLADGLVAVQEEVGLHDGSEPGTLVARAFELEKGAIPTANTQTASTATTVVAAATALVRVTYASGTTTLDFAALAVGQMTRVLKANTSAYGFSVKGGASDQVNGGTAGIAMTLPGSTAALSSSTSDPEWLVYRESGTSLRIYQGGGNAVLLQGRSVSAAAPTDGQPLAWDAANSTWKPTTMSPGRLTALASTQGLWLFDGNLNDSSGNAKNLTVANGTEPLYPTRSNVGKFGCVHTAFRGANTSNWAIGSALTVEAVVRCIAAPGHTIASVASSGTTSTIQWTLNIASSGAIQWQFYSTGATDRSLTSSIYIPYLKLCHIACTLSTVAGDTTTKTFLNGVEIATQTLVGVVPQTVSNPPLSICNFITNSVGFGNTNGSSECHGVAIHSTALDATTIASRALAVLGAG